MMKLVALATSGARLCWAMMYIVPCERKRKSRWEMEGKRCRELVGRVEDRRKKKKVDSKNRKRQRVKGTEETDKTRHKRRQTHKD